MREIKDKIKGISIELDKSTKLNELDNVIVDFVKLNTYTFNFIFYFSHLSLLNYLNLL